MGDWKRICCAVDLSDPSRIAMEQAADLAKRFRAELTLVHVEVPPTPAASDVLVSSRGLADAEAKEAKETLELWRAEAERRAGIPVRSIVRAGEPAAEIVRYAREEGCDLVAIGTHGRTGIKRLVLGSVAEHVVRQSHCAVLVVRDHGLVEKRGESEEASQYT